MKCPRCGSDEDKVVDSRAVRDGRAVRRRRECLACGERYTTYEAVETRPVLVVKRSGRAGGLRPGQGDRGRDQGLREATGLPGGDRDHRRPGRAGAGRLRAAGGAAARPSARCVLDELREVDEVAYVRFASVYRSFQSVEEFFALLRDLRAEDEDQWRPPDRNPADPETGQRPRLR